MLIIVKIMKNIMVCLIVSKSMDGPIPISYASFEIFTFDFEHLIG